MALKYERFTRHLDSRRKQYVRATRTGASLLQTIAVAQFELGQYQGAKLEQQLEEEGRQPTQDEESFLQSVVDFRKALEELKAHGPR